MNSDIAYALAWYLAILLLGWIALPFTYRLFRWLPERGYALAKTVGLLLAGYIYWLLGTAGFLSNHPGSILLAAGLAGGLGLAWLGRDGLAELRQWLNQQAKYVLAAETLFLFAYLLWVVVRAYNPQILGTEKPMEFMFLNAILRSPTFPPQDAWLSGHAISYYYYGFHLMAMLTRLTGVPTGVAFNLSLAGLFALTAANASAVLVNLIVLAKRRLQSEFGEASLAGAFWPSLLAPVLILLVGNWYGALELANRNAWIGDVSIPAVWYDYGSLAADGAMQTNPGVKAGSIGLWKWLDLKGLQDAPSVKPLTVEWGLYNWFFASRAVHDRSLTGGETEVIDEFPAFSFLLGDLHPHVLALPFVLLCIALAVEWLVLAYRTAREGANLQERPGPLIGKILASGLILGSLLFLNTWDFPIYWFLTGLCLAGGLAAGAGIIGVRKHLSTLAVCMGGLFVVGLVLYSPYFLTFQSQAGGILPNLVHPTRIQQTIVMFGPLLVGVLIFLWWAVRRWRKDFDSRAAAWAAGFCLLAAAIFLSAAMLFISINPRLSSLVVPFINPLSIDQAANLLWQRRLLEILSTLLPVLLIALSTGLGVGLIRGAAGEHLEPAGQSLTGQAPVGETPESETPEGGTPESATPESEAAARTPHPAAPLLPLLAVLAMIFTGALLLLGPEYLYLRDNFGTRMNTIFKFYFQIWVLWGIAASFGWWCLIYYGGRAVRWISVIVLLLAILPGAVYLPGSLAVRTGDFSGPPTLDGMAYFAESYPDDWAVIQWLNENVQETQTGLPVILEGTKGAYWVEDRSSRISMATGLPTLLGWANHENQWRGEYYGQVAGRENDIRQIYQARDWETTRALLDLYAVDYVIVSPLEENWYRPAYTAKFERFLTPVFRSGETVVYRVNR